MHFSVLIIGENPELQLDPFWELDLPDEDIAQDYRAEFLSVIPASRLKDRAAKIVAEIEAGEPETGARLRAALEAGRLEEILAEAHGGYLGPEGDWGYYANPDAKWDWFLLGGRWQGSLRLLPGKSGTQGKRSWTNAERPDDPSRCDQARFGKPATEAELGVVTEIIEDLNARADAAITELDETIARVDRLREKIAAFNDKSEMLVDARGS